MAIVSQVKNHQVAWRGSGIGKIPALTDMTPVAATEAPISAASVLRVLGLYVAASRT